MLVVFTLSAFFFLFYDRIWLAKIQSRVHFEIER